MNQSDLALSRPKTRALWMTCMLVLMAPIGAGLVRADHVGAPGGGAADGWVDAHGDTMYGTLRTYDEIEFVDDLGWSRSLAMDGAGTLMYGNDAVCLNHVQATGCGDVTAVRVGTGLTGGGAEGEVTITPDYSVIQRRVVHPCPDGSFIQAISGSGAATCKFEQTYSDVQAVAAVESAGFARSTDLAPVATSGSVLDLEDLSLNALIGMPCSFEGLNGSVALSFGARGEIDLACDAGIDYETDPAHCGGVHQAVPELPNALVGCVDGAPAIVSCTSGFYDRDGNLDNGCESDDPCDDGLSWIDGACVDLQTDPNHCGEPYNPVPDAPNADTSCVAGAFTLTCHDGWGDLDGSFDNGCETPEQSWCSDDDGDGFGGQTCQMAFEAPPGYVADSSDCNDWDPNVNPAAAEIEGDGIDNDCDGVVE